MLEPRISHVCKRAINNFQHLARLACHGSFSNYTLSHCNDIIYYSAAQLVTRFSRKCYFLAAGFTVYKQQPRHEALSDSLWWKCLSKSSMSIT